MTNQTATSNLRRIASQWQQDTVAGDYWTVQIDGDHFPVVVCDDEIIEEFFNCKERPKSARQADGNWSAGYKLGQASASERQFPVFYLGTTDW